MCRETDQLRMAAYLLVALASFITGLVFGQLGGESHGISRINWPAQTVPHPRTLNP